MFRVWSFILHNLREWACKVVGSGASQDRGPRQGGPGSTTSSLHSFPVVGLTVQPIFIADPTR